ncbi:hypothetical protein JRI60_28700 [Archangium violaceum]|uniref:hypothetical protein n=1 Tax=Archangium violaceum TaxID=83451 RepID=UPI00194EC49C|nr:hypothetical protein [Archangium violaceum]QRN93182.1 hypothetical protein JRI60_28700 [Archangium violaceum]
MKHIPLFLVASLAVSTVARAGDPQGMLSMCQQDARTAVRRLQKGGPAEGASMFRTIEEVCIRGNMAPAMRELPGYADVLRDYEEAKRLMQAAEDAVAATSPGGDKKSVSARWEAKPKRCRTTDEWDAAAGIQPEKNKGAAHISGQPSPASGRITWGMFFQRSSNGSPFDHAGPDDYLARLACGYDVEGVDPSFSKYQLWSGKLPEGDPRRLLARELQTGASDSPRGTLYRLALMFHCYASTEWKVPDSYGTYVHCAEALGTTVPTQAEVEAASEAVFPGRAWEKANLVYVAQRTLEAREEVVAAFTRLEAQAPRMKAIFRDSADAARRVHAEFLVRYAEALRTLEPMTAEALRRGAHEGMPADCEEKLLSLRASLEAELQPKDEQGVRELRTGHPLGYQITEALTACYLVRGHLARAKLEAENLIKGSRRVTEEEKVFYARLNARWQAKRDLPTKEQRVQAIPNWEAIDDLPQVPETQSASNDLAEQVRGMQASISTIGNVEEMPAVVVSKRETPEGVWITFKKFTKTYRDVVCENSDEFLRFSVVGRSVRPVFRKTCKDVGPMKKHTFQAEPVLLSKAEADLVQKGMQLEALVNQNDPADSVLVNLWKQQGSKQPLVLDGIRLR